MSEPDYFAIVAGEHSGDRLGAGLMSALKQRYPGVSFRGIGGPAMIDAGFDSMHSMERLAVMGFVEPLGRLPELFRIKRSLREAFVGKPPLAFIGIDSPDFNLRLAGELRNAGVKTVQYVSPSVWAYREKRIHKIKTAVDLMLTLFPFETAIYKQHGIPVACVGHPLADQIGFDDQKEKARRQLDLAADAPVVALMPGSRRGEISRLATDFLSAAALALQEQPALVFVLPYSSPANRDLIEQVMARLGLFPGEQFRLTADSHVAMSAADGVLMASGTATLEALLLRRPMVIAYKLAPLTFAIARRMVKLKHVGLPNLLAGRALAPEYLQGQVKPEVLCAELLALFKGERRDEMIDEFDRIHRQLRRNASSVAAETVSALVRGDLDSYLQQRGAG